MKLKPGRTCAACVTYEDKRRYSWIITKVEKKLSGGKYLVRDEYANDEKFQRYTVPSNCITPFPATGEEYKPGEKVLALWHDDESKEWSTMFYEAKIASVKTNGKVFLVYRETDKEIEIPTSRIARFPTDFDVTAMTNTNDEEEDIGTAANKPVVTKPSVEEEKKRRVQTQTEAIEGRRLKLMFSAGEDEEKSKSGYLTDDDFVALAGGQRPFKRMETIPGTPLLDSLADPELFDQEEYTHVTGTGMICIPRSSEDNQSALLSSHVRFGRLGWILNEWKNI